MRVGDYELLEQIGRGGSGLVHRALAPDRSEVAVKLIALPTEQARARFDREVRLQSKLGAESGFVPVLASGLHPRGAYVVMPLIRGGTLRDQLERGRLEVDATVALGRALAGALGRAHALGIVHRDVKPENVLFSGSQPLLTDCGIAKHFDREAAGASASVSLSTSGTFHGTLAYASPEQLTDAKSVDARSDVFSLGVVLYECLAGEPPFEGSSSVELVSAVTEGRHVPLAKVRADCPRWLVRVVEKALAVDPDARFADGAALARGLAGAPRGVAAIVVPAVIATAVVTVVVTAGATIALTRTVAPPAPPPAAVSSGPSKRANVLIERGAARERDGDLAGALAEYEQAVVADPGLGEAWAHRAFVRNRRGDVDGAIADYTKAVAIDPTLSPAWNNRGYLRETRGDTEGALADYGQAVKANPRNAGSWTQRGSLRIRLGDVAGAVDDFAQAAAIEPKNAVYWTNLAVARERLGDVIGAIADYTRAVEADPVHAPAWNDRGRLKQARGDEDGAFDDYTRALEADPKPAVFWNNRGVIREHRGDIDGAILDYAAAIERDPANADAWNNRAVLRARKGDAAGALSDLTHAVQADPRHARAWLNRGLIREKRGELDGAADDYGSAAAADPRLWEPWFARGSLRRSQGRSEEAARDFAAYLERAEPGDANVAPTREWLRARVPR